MSKQLPKTVNVKKFLDAFQTEIDSQEFAIDETEWSALLKSIREALIYAATPTPSKGDKSGIKGDI